MLKIIIKTVFIIALKEDWEENISIFFQVGNYFKLFKNSSDLIKGASLFFDFGYSFHGGQNEYKDPIKIKDIWN